MPALSREEGDGKDGGTGAVTSSDCTFVMLVDLCSVERGSVTMAVLSTAADDSLVYMYMMIQKCG